jgi:anti-sigma regulatory factor (Ser/Thr protein kinase)
MEPGESSAMTTVRPWTALMVRSASEPFPPTLSSPREVRSFVSTTIRNWGFHNLCETAELLVSEVVTNVVVHARTPGRATVTALPAGIRIEVTDGGRDLPGERQPGPSEPDGRGLGIVSALARRWGIEVEHDTKTVWFELDDDADAAPTA